MKLKKETKVQHYTRLFKEHNNLVDELNKLKETKIKIDLTNYRFNDITTLTTSEMQLMLGKIYQYNYNGNLGKSYVSSSKKENNFKPLILNDYVHACEREIKMRDLSRKIHDIYLQLKEIDRLFSDDERYEVEIINNIGFSNLKITIADVNLSISWNKDKSSVFSKSLYDLHGL